MLSYRERFPGLDAGPPVGEQTVNRFCKQNLIYFVTLTIADGLRLVKGRVSVLFLYSFVLVYPAYRRIISGIPQDNSGRS
jgi:hypothetical protein